MNNVEFLEKVTKIHQQFSNLPYSNSFQYYNICLLLAYCQDIKISSDGICITFQNNTFATFDLVLYLYCRKKKFAVQKPMFEQVYNYLNLL